MKHCSYAQQTVGTTGVDRPMQLYLIKYKEYQTMGSVRMEFICAGLIWQTVTHYDRMSLYSPPDCFEAAVFFLPDKCLSAEVKTEEGNFRHNSFQICVFLSAVCVWLHVWRN